MGERRGLAQLFEPYSSSPPPALNGTARPDLFTRLAGIAVPNFVSVIMGLGGDKELPELPAASNRRAMRVADRRIVARDANVAELTLVDADGAALPGWHPGAHVDVHLPSGRMRQYSLCGDPAKTSEYRIAVRHIPDGGGGSVEIHGLTIDDCVEISTPRNGFMMPVPGSASQAAQLRFIAGGIGITPILPMVRLAESLGVPWSLRYAGRHRASLPYVDELLALGALRDNVQLCIDDDRGLPTAADLLDGVDERSAVYVCGPAPLIGLVRQNVPTGTELHVERFSPPLVVNGSTFELELARNGEVVRVGEDQSALAALRTVRPNVAYSCQQGFCGTCVQRVLAGEVEHRDNILTDRQRELGHMLVCVSRGRAGGARLVLDV
jgi:ferredoxin-NADP reductase